MVLERFVVLAHLLVDAAQAAGGLGFHLPVVEFACNGYLVFEAGDGLFEVAQDAVQVAQFTVGLRFGTGVVQFVGYYQTLFVAY